MTQRDYSNAVKILRITKIFHGSNKIISFIIMDYSVVADAGLFDDSGQLLGSASSPIQIWKDRDCVEVTTN